MSPAACPECHHYEYLTNPDPVEGFRKSLHNEIVCENCGWTGEPDDLDEVDSRGPET